MASSLIQLLIAVLVADFGITTIHLASHKVGWLWRLHAVHHSVRRFYGFNGLMKHPLHQTIEMAGGVLPLIVLGIPVEVAAALSVCVAVQLLLQHANVDYRIGPLRSVLALNEGHRFHHLKWAGIEKIVISLIASPLVGGFVGFTIMVVLMWSFRRAIPSDVTNIFRPMQVLAAAFMAFSHGTNDAQKAMGIITMALVAYNAPVGSFFHIPPGHFAVPYWVAFACATMMALGTAVGGWRIIATMGKKVMGFQPVHGFAAETTAAAIIETASALGAPVSTTHVISAAILGVGSTKRLSAVRWGIARKIVVAWVLTIPASAAMAALFMLLFERIFG